MGSAIAGPHGSTAEMEEGYSGAFLLT